jgi:aspartate kinase
MIDSYHYVCTVMGIEVHKFGGDAMLGERNIGLCAQEIVKIVEDGKTQVAVVVSAERGYTDEVIARWRDKDPTAKLGQNADMDLEAAQGELESVARLSKELKSLGILGIDSLTPDRIPFEIVSQRQSNRMKAHIISGPDGRPSMQLNYVDSPEPRIHRVNGTTLIESFEKNRVLVVPGFIGLNSTGQVVTLGRSGSDLTAVAFAHALSSSSGQRVNVIFGKKEANILSAPPEFIEGAVGIESMTHPQLMAMLNASDHEFVARRAAKAALELNVNTLFQQADCFVAPGTKKPEGTWVKANVSDRIEDRSNFRAVGARKYLKIKTKDAQVFYWMLANLAELGVPTIAKDPVMYVPLSQASKYYQAVNESKGTNMGRPESSTEEVVIFRVIDETTTNVAEHIFKLYSHLIGDDGYRGRPRISAEQETLLVEAPLEYANNIGTSLAYFFDLTK